MEYEIWAEYEFSDDGEKWTISTLKYIRYQANPFTWSHIRPIQISEPIRSAISLLEQAGYKITKL